MLEQARQEYYHLLEQFPPAVQEELLLKGADDVRARLKQIARRDMKATVGKFLVAGVRIEDDTDWDFGEFDTVEHAKSRIAEVRAEAQGYKLRIYDENGLVNEAD